MKSYEPKPHEQIFNVRPIGVKYICEFCNIGEMKVDTTSPIQVPNMYPHKCTKCGKEMLLPQVYPYIEWVEIDEQDVINETMEIVKALKEETDKLEKAGDSNEAN